MKTIGLIGGMSWESTAVYYRLLNTGVRDRLGGLHSAKIALWSVDFAEIARLQADARWAEAAERMVDAAQRVERAGAELLLIATNTMHLMAPEVQAAVNIPLVHIAEATALALTARAVANPCCSAPASPWSRRSIAIGWRRAGSTQRVPNEAEREEIHRIIYDELCRGVVRPGSKQSYLEMAKAGLARGADSVILGCTEIGMLLSQADFSVPVVDSTEAHCKRAIELALG